MTGNPPTNLNQLVSWTKVLEALEIEVAAGVLPCSVYCPSCGSDRLSIYQDTTQGGQWHHCSGCERAGDMVELAARVWNLDITDTLSKLEQPAQPGAVELYKQRYVDYRKKVNNFWQSCQEQFLTSDVLSAFCLDMGIASHLTSENWQRTGARFIGSATRRDVDEFVNHNPCDSIFHKYGPQVKKWREVFVIPFRDLPGRIVAFLFCHEQAGKAQPFKYFSVESLRPNWPAIAALEALGDKPPQFIGDTAFVFTDPVLTIRTHLKHYEIHRESLPIVGIWPKTPPCDYLRSHAAGRDLVFFTQTFTPDVFNHAKAANARLVTHDGREDLFYFLRRMTPLEWMQRLKREARRWDTVLEDQLATKPLLEVEHLLFNIDWKENELRDFVEGCTTQVKQRIEPICRKRYYSKRVSVNGEDIAETEKGLILLKHDEVVSDASLHLKQVIVYKNGHNYYQGEIVHQGKTYAFTAPTADVDEAPFVWMRKELLRQGAPLIAFNVYWQRHAMAIATRLSAPVTVTGADNYGWDEQRCGFVLPEWLIEVGGKVSGHSLPCPAGIKPPKLPKPERLTLTDVARLDQNTPEVSLIWAITTCLLNNVLSGPLVSAPKGLLISGEIMPAALKLAKGLGCPMECLAPKERTPEPSVRHQEELSRAWPTIYEGQLRGTAQVQGWMRLQPHNCIVTADWYTARAYRLEAPWFLLEASDGIRTCPDIQLAGKLLCAFLLALCERRMKPWTQAAERQVFLQKNLTKWWREQGGQTDAPQYGLTFLQTDYEGYQTDTFFELMCRFVDEGWLGFIHASHRATRQTKPAVVFVDDGEPKVWVPKAGINYALSKLSKATTDIGSLTAALWASGVLLDEQDYQGVPGWLFNEELWNQRITMWRRQKGRVLGIVS